MDDLKNNTLFNEFEIQPSLIQALEKQNIITPTEVQKNVIPKVLDNKDLVVESETGTGKTLAYILPLFKKIDTGKNQMQAIILTPTHELAIQVLRVIEQLSLQSEVKVSSTSIIGNVNIKRQIDNLKKKPNIIVGSLGRILELIKKKKISAHTIKTIVIDEADRLMDKNNIENVKEIIKTTLKERQILLFSASITKETKAHAKDIMKCPEFIIQNSSQTVPDTIEHMYFLTEERDKMEILRKIIGILKPQRAIVFIGERQAASACTDKLKYHGFKAEEIQGHNNKMARKMVLDEFKKGKIQLLIASDIAARGLDIENVSHIINLNIPEHSRDYLHRVGRTGRKGKEGIAISLVTKRELEFIKTHKRELKIKIKPKDMYMGKIIDKVRNWATDAFTCHY